MSAIRLFRCMKCHGVLDETETDRKEGCSCGSHMFTESYVTRKMVWRYLLARPKKLLQAILEGGWHRQAEPEPLGRGYAERDN